MHDASHETKPTAAEPTSAGPNDEIAGDSYTVVARRYRPQTFEELIGQGHVAKGLSGAIATGRVGHAYLFTGARGVGKTSAARILAKALNCQEGPTATPCNACDICRSIAAGSDVDVLEIDGASNRGIDEIRQLRQNAGVRPSRARFKIYIIDEVHMLTKDAFNALLKTLEEPPEHVKFIFATTEPNKIPITILSRCQRFDFAGIGTDEIETRLGEIAAAEGLQAEPEAVALLARRAAGSMRDGQSLLEQLLALGRDCITVEDVTRMLGTAPAARLGDLAEKLVTGDAAGALAELDGAVAGGVEVAQLIDQLLAWFRDVMVTAAGGGPELLHAPASQADAISGCSAQLGVETTLALLQILEQSASRMRSSLHPRAVAEMALVRIAHLEQLDELPALIATLRGEDAGGPPRRATASPSRQPGAKQAAAPKERGARRPPGVIKDGAGVKKNGAAEAAPGAVTRPAAPRAATPAADSTASANEGDVSDAPAVGPAPPVVPLTEASAAEVWRQVLDRLGDMVADQASLFDGVAISGPNRLVVTFPAKYTSCKAFCERPEQKEKLQRALSEATGGDVGLEFALRADTPREEPPAPRRDTRRQLQADVLRRPLVERAVQRFGADSVRVETPEE